jgi:hypothetical protein
LGWIGSKESNIFRGSRARSARHNIESKYYQTSQGVKCKTAHLLPPQDRTEAGRGGGLGGGGAGDTGNEEAGEEQKPDEENEGNL